MLYFQGKNEFLLNMLLNNLSLTLRLSFCSEIRMAPGLLTSADAASEVVLFTTDEELLCKVAKHDENAG